MFMILFVLDDTGSLDDVLQAWEEAGVGGITILPSTGMARLKQMYSLQDDLPLIPSLQNFLHHEENLNRTLFTIVENESAVDRVVEATQSVTGDLNNPNTGILVALPVMRAYGLNRKNGTAG